MYFENGDAILEAIVIHLQPVAILELYAGVDLPWCVFCYGWR